MELSDGYMNRDATAEDLAANMAAVMSEARSPLTATSSKAVRHLMSGFRP
jgi:hypothetical protein